VKMLPIILAVLAVSFIVPEERFGPIYTMYDGCTCGQRRAWLEFEESPSLRRKQLFLRIEEPGDPKHQHQFWDAQYGGQYHVFLYIGFGCGILSAASWIYQRKRP
jgi:hypothetical protein